MSLRKDEKIAVFIAVVLAFIFLFVSMTFFNSEDKGVDLSGVLGTEEVSQEGLPSQEGIVISRIKDSDGEVVQAGYAVAVHYVGTLEDGTKFDSSLDRGQPFQYVYGAGQVIPGWEIGLQGMKVGEVRRLVISPELGYGENAVGPIPANSTLIFEVELLAVQEPQTEEEE